MGEQVPTKVTTLITAKEFGERVGFTHLETIRRIRKGQIAASKVGWFYIIKAEEVERVKSSDWYKKVMKRRGLEASSA